MKIDTFTPIHNEILEALCKINLSPYETRCLFVIWRKTYGFVDRETGQRKKEDYIALSQFSELTKLDKRHISRALKGLKEKNVISRDDKKTSFSKKFLNLLSSVEMIKTDNIKKMSSVEMTTIPSRDDNLSSVEGDTKETLTKETIQKKYTSIKNLTEKDFEEISNDYGVTIQFVRSKFEDLQNYCGAKGKKYSNYKLALRNFVKKAFEEKGGKLKMPTEELELKRQQLIRQFGINN